MKYSNEKSKSEYSFIPYTEFGGGGVVKPNTPILIKEGGYIISNKTNPDDYGNNILIKELSTQNVYKINIKLYGSKYLYISKNNKMFAYYITSDSTGKMRMYFDKPSEFIVSSDLFELSCDKADINICKIA